MFQVLWSMSGLWLCVLCVRGRTPYRRWPMFRGFQDWAGGEHHLGHWVVGTRRQRPDYLFQVYCIWRLWTARLLKVLWHLFQWGLSRHTMQSMYKISLVYLFESLCLVLMWPYRNVSLTLGVLVIGMASSLYVHLVPYIDVGSWTRLETSTLGYGFCAKGC